MENKKPIKVSLLVAIFVAGLIVVIIGFVIHNITLSMYTKDIANVDNTIDEIVYEEKIEEILDVETTDINNEVIEEVNDYIKNIVNMRNGWTYYDNYQEDNALIENLYSYIFNTNFMNAGAKSTLTETGILNFHKAEKVTASKLNNKEKLLIVCLKLDDGTRNFVSKKEFDEEFYTFFGKDETIKYEDIEVIFTKYIFNNDGLNIVNEEGGIGWPWVEDAKLIAFEKNEDSLYLYDIYVYLDVDGPGYFSYADAENKILIEELVYDGDDSEYNKGNVEKYKEVMNLKIDEIYKVLMLYGEKVPIYKHTFKLDNDNSYYWVSSELYTNY